MQYVAYIPVFLALVFGGGYLFDKGHDTEVPTTPIEQVPAPVEQPKIEKNTVEPAVEKKTVSVPTSQPVVKPTEKKKKNDDYVSASDEQLMRDIHEATKFEPVPVPKYPVQKIVPPKPITSPSWNCKNTISKNSQGKTYISSIDCN